MDSSRIIAMTGECINIVKWRPRRIMHACVYCQWSCWVRLSPDWETLGFTCITQIARPWDFWKACQNEGGICFIQILGYSLFRWMLIPGEQLGCEIMIKWTIHVGYPKERLPLGQEWKQWRLCFLLVLFNVAKIRVEFARQKDRDTINATWGCIWLKEAYTLLKLYM